MKRTRCVGKRGNPSPLAEDRTRIEANKGKKGKQGKGRRVQGGKYNQVALGT